MHNNIEQVKMLTLNSSILLRSVRATALVVNTVVAKKLLYARGKEFSPIIRLNILDFGLKLSLNKSKEANQRINCIRL